MTKTARGPNYHWILKLVRANWSQKDIAAHMGLPRTRVYNAVRSARVVGDLPPARRSTAIPMSFSHAAKRSGVRAGNPLDILRDVSPDVMYWLLDETPLGSSVMELIRGIVIDAYNEAKDSAALAAAKEMT